MFANVKIRLQSVCVDFRCAQIHGNKNFLKYTSQWFSVGLIERFKYISILGYTMVTTIKIHEGTKQQLDLFREYKNESYDEVIKKMIYIAKKAKTQPKLSKEIVIAIEKARKRIKAGNFVSEEEAKKRLGF